MCWRLSETKKGTEAGRREERSPRHWQQRKEGKEGDFQSKNKEYWANTCSQSPKAQSTAVCNQFNEISMGAINSGFSLKLTWSYSIPHAISLQHPGDAVLPCWDQARWEIEKCPPLHPPLSPFLISSPRFHWTPLETTGFLRLFGLFNVLSCISVLLFFNFASRGKG